MELRDRNGLTEPEFLREYAKKSYPRPYLTADLVLLAPEPLSVLLIRRGGHPALGKWAIPGGFVNPDESAFDAALRELNEETGVDADTNMVREIGLFSKPGRDPRGWVVTDAFCAPVRREQINARAGDDAADARWFTIEQAPNGALTFTADALCLAESERSLTLSESDLAFDHADIIRRALQFSRSIRG